MHGDVDRGFIYERKRETTLHFVSRDIGGVD
jgi:hypothetical protein